MRRETQAPPVRIVHLGLGAFSRSHIAWYTQHSADAQEWGIAAYTGRSHALADALSRQDGLYTLVERDAEGDRAEIISSIVRAHPGDDQAALISDVAHPQTAIVTLTITEAGYRLSGEGSPDTSDPLVAQDLELLHRVASGATSVHDARPQTTLVRLVLALEQRRRSDAGPIALFSCDNVPDNGGRLGRGIASLAASLSPELHSWVEQNVSFPSSSVDRITPQVGEAELQTLALRLGDEAPVVAEPFSDWVIEGSFPAGRPRWEAAGARFVDDLEPWEARKLWMLNGAHTLLASLGQLRGHQTVAEAIGDPFCREAVADLWDEDSSCLPAALAAGEYGVALLDRFENARIEHRLEQIARDSFLKLRLRILPVAKIVLARGGRPAACAVAVAAWWVAADRSLLPPDATAPTRDAKSGVRLLVAELNDQRIDAGPFEAAVEAAYDRLLDLA